MARTLGDDVFPHRHPDWTPQHLTTTAAPANACAACAPHPAEIQLAAAAGRQLRLAAARRPAAAARRAAAAGGTLRALRRGAYKPLVGGHKGCGLCTMGSFSYSYSALPEGMVVGRYCSISSGLRVLDSTHPTGLLTTSAITFRPKNRLFDGIATPRLAEFAAAFDVDGGKGMPVLEHDVWIGANVTLAMGVRIGTGAIVASGAMVTCNVPPYAVVAGKPGAVRKMRFPEALVAELLASRWWDVDPSFLFDLDFTDPAAVCRRLAVEGDAVPRYLPAVLKLALTALRELNPPHPAFKASSDAHMTQLVAELTPEQVEAARAAGVQLARECNCREG